MLHNTWIRLRMLSKAHQLPPPKFLAFNPLEVAGKGRDDVNQAAEGNMHGCLVPGVGNQYEPVAFGLKGQQG